MPDFVKMPPSGEGSSIEKPGHFLAVLQAAEVLQQFLV
jgi:hypothetical protein